MPNSFDMFMYLHSQRFRDKVRDWLMLPPSDYEMNRRQEIAKVYGWPPLPRPVGLKPPPPPAPPQKDALSQIVSDVLKEHGLSRKNDISMDWWRH